MKRTITAFLCSIIILILFAGLAGSALSSTESATQQLKGSIDKLLEVLKDPELKAEDQKEVRREKLRIIAKERFDFRMMSQRSLARHWKGLTDEQKDEFTELFGSLLEDSYMSKIEAYTDEEVVYLKELVKKKKTREYAQINTKIITDEVEIPINYRMYRQDEKPWMVYDMIIEGVSMVNNYRSQFGQILEKKSFDSLVEQLKDKKE
ncbi:MAG: ABC transporter substrate-binding protein [Desulfobacterales bacterium]|nr:ABC transporter substrate-binding protein [Desulfobacterales bacterium]